MLAAAALLHVVLSASQLKLATVGFTQVGLSDAQAAFYAEHFSVQLASVDEQNVRVTTPKDMAAVLGVEKQRALLGCSDEGSSCMAELAGALGADGIVTGQVAKVGKSFQLNVKILAPDGSRTLFLHSSKLLPTEEDLIEELNQTARVAIAKLRPEPAVAAVAAVATAPSASTTATAQGGKNPLKLLPGVLGLAGVVLSAVAFSTAQDRYNKLSDRSRWPSLTEMQAGQWRDDGKNNVVNGVVFLSLGVVFLVGALVWFLVT